jgi:hypothetical protein
MHAMQNPVAPGQQKARSLRQIGQKMEEPLPSFAHRKHSMSAIPVKVKALAKDRQLPMQNEKERDGEHTGLLGRPSDKDVADWVPRFGGTGSHRFVITGQLNGGDEKLGRTLRACFQASHHLRQACARLDKAQSSGPLDLCADEAAHDTHVAHVTSERGRRNSMLGSAGDIKSCSHKSI